LSGVAGAFGFEAGGWIIYIVGGILGIILISMLFDWALIGLSAFGGATLLVQGFALEGSSSALVLIVLLILGFGIQASAMQKDRKKHD
jgi:arginine exporter protein ArgO